MTINDIGTQHFLKRMMDTYNDPEIGIKNRRLQKLITIEEVAKELQDYLNTHEDSEIIRIDPVTGERKRIDYLENIQYVKMINVNTGEEEIISTIYNNKYKVTVNQELSLKTNHPVYALNYNNDFEINWSPRNEFDGSDDTLDPFIWIRIDPNSPFNQIPILIFNKIFASSINPYSFERVYHLHDAILTTFTEEEQKFLNVKWFRDFDKSFTERRVNPPPNFFAYEGDYKLTFLDGRVNVEDLALFFNKELRFEYNIKFSN